MTKSFVKLKLMDLTENTYDLFITFKSTVIETSETKE